MSEARQRAFAHKINVNTLKKGNYVKEDGEFTPNYIQIGPNKISRVNMMGVIVSKEDMESSLSFTIDDGSDNILVRWFDQNQVSTKVDVGDVVNIIGRPREYNGERYLMPEILKKIDSRWMSVRKKELNGIIVEDLPKTEEIQTESIEEETTAAKNEDILNFIRKSDSGEGVEIEAILKSLSIKEDTIQSMLKEGDIFENVPGKLKVLE